MNGMWARGAEAVGRSATTDGIPCGEGGSTVTVVGRPGPAGTGGVFIAADAVISTQDEPFPDEFDQDDDMDDEDDGEDTPPFDL